MRKSILARGIVLLAFFTMCAAHAQEASPDDAEQPQGWAGSGELGFVATSGNTETQTLNAQIGLEYTSDPWVHSATLTAIGASEDEDTTAERYELAAKSKYLLSEVSYTYGALRYEDDRFSGFDYQAILTAGYGRTLLDSETQHLDAEIGLGVRRSKPVGAMEAMTDPVLRGAALYWWQISDTTRFENNFLVEAGSDNTYLEDTLALSVAINSDLALKLGYSIRHNTDVAPGIDNTDTITTVNLVYSFL